MGPPVSLPSPFTIFLLLPPPSPPPPLPPLTDSSHRRPPPAAPKGPTARSNRGRSTGGRQIRPPATAALPDRPAPGFLHSVGTPRPPASRPAASHLRRRVVSPPHASHLQRRAVAPASHIPATRRALPPPTSGDEPRPCLPHPGDRPPHHHPARCADRSHGLPKLTLPWAHLA